MRGFSEGLIRTVSSLLLPWISAHFLIRSEKAWPLILDLSLLYRKNEEGNLTQADHVNQADIYSLDAYHTFTQSLDPKLKI